MTVRLYQRLLAERFAILAMDTHQHPRFRHEPGALAAFKTALLRGARLRTPGLSGSLVLGTFVTALLAGCVGPTSVRGDCLRPRQVLVVVNDASPESVELGEYYLKRRKVPKANLCRVKTVTGFHVTRAEYETHGSLPPVVTSPHVYQGLALRYPPGLLRSVRPPTITVYWREDRPMIELTDPELAEHPAELLPPVLSARDSLIHRADETYGFLRRDTAC